MRSLLSFCIVLSIFTGHLAAQNNRRNEANRYPPSFEGAKEIVYKKIGNDEFKDVPVRPQRIGSASTSS